jgi:solute carrier family 20 (sodium-dependent phosphate transporter)
MAFGVGANGPPFWLIHPTYTALDAANSWGTSVGSGAIPIKYALYCAGFFELLGAVTLGRGVSEKLQEGVSDITDENCWACGYCNSQISVYDLGMLASLIAGACFLLIATATSLPVSTTHAIVGAIVGMTISNVGSSCVNWSFGGVGGIFASWIISPVLSGVLAIIFYRSALSVIFGSQDPRGRILFALPWIFSVVCFVMFILILTKSPSAQVLMSLPFSLSLFLSLSVSHS